MERLISSKVRVGNDLVIGGGSPIVVQTMCNTHTSDVDATVAQCLRLAAAGAQMVRITVPGLQDVPAVFILVIDCIHGLFDQEYSQSANASLFN